MFRINQKFIAFKVNKKLLNVLFVFNKNLVFLKTCRYIAFTIKLNENIFIVSISLEKII